jgi:hypothetical protein
MAEEKQIGVALCGPGVKLDRRKYLEPQENIERLREYAYKLRKTVENDEREYHIFKSNAVVFLDNGMQVGGIYPVDDFDNILNLETAIFRALVDANLDRDDIEVYVRRKNG